VYVLAYTYEYVQLDKYTKLKTKYHNSFDVGLTTFLHQLTGVHILARSKPRAVGLKNILYYEEKI
jgi:hypothetical protein